MFTIKVEKDGQEVKTIQATQIMIASSLEIEGTGGGEVHLMGMDDIRQALFLTLLAQDTMEQTLQNLLVPQIDEQHPDASDEEKRAIFLEVVREFIEQAKGKMTAAQKEPIGENVH